VNQAHPPWPDCYSKRKTVRCPQVRFASPPIFSSGMREVELQSDYCTVVVFVTWDWRHVWDSKMGSPNWPNKNCPILEYLGVPISSSVRSSKDDYRSRLCNLALAPCLGVQNGWSGPIRTAQKGLFNKECPILENGGFRSRHQSTFHGRRQHPGNLIKTTMSKFKIRFGPALRQSHWSTKALLRNCRQDGTSPLADKVSKLRALEGERIEPWSLRLSEIPRGTVPCHEPC